MGAFFRVGMVDLSEEMTALADRLGPPPGASARVVQFVSARAGEGTSTVAREFARTLAPIARRGVWLVELDVMRGGQFEALAARPDVFGELGEETRASPGPDAFFRVAPEMYGVDGQPWPDANYLGAYPVGEQRFWVTRFRRELLRPGQSVHITGGDGYWNALRAHADWVVVDAPSVERSRAAMAVAAHMDTNLLVVSAEDGDPRGPAFARDGLVAAGGRCGGVVLNRMRAPAPRFLRALAP